MTAIPAPIDQLLVPGTVECPLCGETLWFHGKLGNATLQLADLPVGASFGINIDGFAVTDMTAVEEHLRLVHGHGQSDPED